MSVYDPNASTRTWYVDHEHTHDEEGLACVTDDGPYYNLVGVGPDMILQGLTPKQCVDALRGMGFTELDTDVLELEQAWHEGCPKDGISWHGDRGECQYCGTIVAPEEAGHESGLLPLEDRARRRDRRRSSLCLRRMSELPWEMP